MKSILLAAFFFSCTCTLQIQAQNKKSVPTGTITGQVVDCNDGVIQKAVVVLKNKKINRQVVTNANGYFEIKVPYGKYELIIAPPSTLKFSKFREENIEIKSDSSDNFKITLGSMFPVVIDLY